MSKYFVYPNTPEKGSFSWGDRVEDMGITRESLEHALRYSGANADEDDDQSAHEVYTLNLRMVETLSANGRQVEFTRAENMLRSQAPTLNTLGKNDLGGSVRSYWPVRRFADAVSRGILVKTNKGRWQFSLVDVDSVSDIQCRQYWRFHGLHGQTRPEETVVTLGDVFPERRVLPERLSPVESFQDVMLCNFLTPKMTMPPLAAEKKYWITTATRSRGLIVTQRDSRNNLRENRFIENDGSWGPDTTKDLILRSPLVTRDWLIWRKEDGGDDKLYLWAITGTRVAHPRDEAAVEVESTMVLDVDASDLATVKASDTRRKTIEIAAVVKEFERRDRLPELIAFSEVFIISEDDNYTGVLEVHLREGKMKSIKYQVTRFPGI